MNAREPSLLERAVAAIRRWAYEQRRVAEDEKYWRDAQHDRRLVVDIGCARARSELEPPVIRSRRTTSNWAMLAPAMTQPGALDR